MAKFLVFFSISYILAFTIISLLKLTQISTININLFCFCLSLNTALIILFLEDNELRFKLKSTILVRKLLIFSATIVLALLLFNLYFANTGQEFAFKEWGDISFLDLSSYIAAFSILLYVPSYILHNVINPKWKLNLLEQIVFYPIISTPILVFLKVAGDAAHFNIPYGLVVPSLLIAMFIVYYYRHFSNKIIVSHIHLDVDLKELSIIVGALIFNLIIFYLAIGSNGAFLRGDMWPETGNIAFLNKNDLSDFYLPGTSYPPFSRVLNSAISSLIPFPFINGVIVSAFFNHFFSVLAFFLLAKILFRDSKKAAIAVTLWTIISGLSWTYLVFNPSVGGETRDIVLLISQRYGVYSGSIITPTSADGEALTRLWSLGLLFVSVAALLKSYFEKKDFTSTLLIFSLSTVQIIFGHITEVPVIGLVVFLLIVLDANPFSKFSRMVFLSALFSSIIGVFLVAFFSNWNIVFLIMSFIPILGVLFGIFSLYLSKAIRWVRAKYLADALGGLSQKIRMSTYNVRVLVCVLLIYFFGLSWLSFFGSPNGIHWPITTFWYSYAVQWGVLGGIAVLTIFWFGLKKDKIQLSLKFAISLLFLQFVLIVSLNFVNQNFMYITIPYPFQPILFMPVLALIGSQLFPQIRFKKSKHKIRNCVLVVSILLILTFGSLDYILSSSYWNINNGWWESGDTLNPSSADYELINYLYQQTSENHYIGTYYDWNNPESYVVIPSGNYLLSLPLIEILTTATDPRELYVLKQAVGMSYVLVCKNESSLPENSFLNNALRSIDPVFINTKYELYSFSQLNLTQTSTMTKSKDFVTSSKISFEGNLTYKDLKNQSFNIENAKGSIYPIGDGLVTFSIQSRTKQIENSTVLTPWVRIDGDVTLEKMRSTWKYFYESDCIADQIVISGQTSFQIFNSFSNRIYMDPLTYTGQYVAYPSVGYLRPDNAKEVINYYATLNNIDVSTTIKSNVGIAWLILTFAIVLIILRSQIFLYFKSDWRQKPSLIKLQNEISKDHHKGRVK